MAETITSLEELQAVAGGDAAAPAIETAPPREPQRDALGRSYATGKRKQSVARVWIKPGSGKVTVNGKEMGTYFARPVLQMILRQPFTVAGVEGEFDVYATVKGGGLSGQAGAVKHGISVALQRYEPGLRGALKAAGFLTRDSRVVERKKFGRARPAAASSSPSAEFRHKACKGPSGGRPFCCLHVFVNGSGSRQAASQGLASSSAKWECDNDPFSVFCCMPACQRGDDLCRGASSRGLRASRWRGPLGPRGAERRTPGTTVAGPRSRCRGHVGFPSRRHRHHALRRPAGRPTDPPDHKPRPLHPR